MFCPCIRLNNIRINIILVNTRGLLKLETSSVCEKACMRLRVVSGSAKKTCVCSPINGEVSISFFLLCLWFVSNSWKHSSLVFTQMGWQLPESFFFFQAWELLIRCQWLLAKDRGTHDTALFETGSLRSLSQQLLTSHSVFGVFFLFFFNLLLIST